MATAKPNPAVATPTRPARRWLVPGGLALALLALVAGWGPMHQRARLVVARAAREACSCRHMGGRTLGDCRKGLTSTAPGLWLSEDAGGQSVTARLLPLASDTATFRDGAGCQLGPWKD